MTEGTPTGFEPQSHTEGTIEKIRDYIDGRIMEADRRYKERDDANKEALRIAQETNNARLDTMNEFRASLSDQAARLPTREELQVMVSGLRAEAEKNLAPMQIKLDTLGKPNITGMAAFLTASIAVVSAGWVIIGLKIDATNLPTQVAIQATKTSTDQLNSRMLTIESNSMASTQADSISRSDRAQLNSRLTSLEQITTSNSGELRSLAALSSSKLVEVETQFKLLSDILNMDKDQDQRLLALLWKKAYPSTDLPPILFRPQMFKN